MKRPPWPLFLEVLPLLSPASRAVTKKSFLASAGPNRVWRQLHASRPLAASLFDEPIERRASSSVKWTKYEDGVLPLWIADMDFRSPQCIIDALKARADDGIFGYTYPPPELKDAVVDYLARVHNWKVDPSWIVFLHGLVPGLAVASRMAGSEGDEVMVNTPVYPPFLWTPRTAGCRMLSVSLRFEEVAQEWVMNWEAMEALVTPRTRMFVLCNPHNPVGKVFSAEELRRLGDFCKRHNLVLCSDEIHCDLVLSEEKRHTSLAALQDPELLARSITLHAPSKTYNVPGLCCSYAVIPDEPLRHRFKKAARGFVTEINCMGYEACRVAYTDSEPWRLELIKYLRDNRDFATEFIKNNIPGLRTYPGLDATYLMWLDATPLLEKLPRGSDPATFFLESAKVALSDGRDFSGSGHIRLNFGCPRSVLQEALERMARAVRPFYPEQ